MSDTCDACPGFDDTLDTDGDGAPDGCDICPADPANDGDGDGLCAGADNCPLAANPGQDDADGDGLGDVCDDDDDNDGVPDAGDECPGTEPGAAVDADGCSLAQLCPCEGDWKNHGAYVSCMAHATNDFVAAGLITGADKGAIMSEAGASSCGHKH